jgi:hypothetical protein
MNAKSHLNRVQTCRIEVTLEFGHHGDGRVTGHQSGDEEVQRNGCPKCYEQESNSSN